MLKADNFEFKRGVLYFLKPMSYREFKRVERMCILHGKRNYKSFDGIKKWDFQQLVIA